MISQVRVFISTAGEQQGKSKREQLTGNASAAAQDLVEGLAVFVEVAHEFHFFALFGEARVVDQLGTLR